MKTLHTIYTSFAKRTAIILTLLLTLGITSAWGAEEVMYPNNNTTFTSNWNKTTRTQAAKYADDKYAIQLMKLSGGVYGEISSKKTYSNIVGVSVKVTASSSRTLTLYYSIDNSTWTELSSISVSKSTASYSAKSFSVTNIPSGALYLKFRSDDNSVYIYSVTVTTASGYAVTYSNGGHGTAPSNTTASSVTLSPITATGYTNTGWKANVAVKNTSTGTTITANTLITNGTNVTLTQATTFTAQWQANKYTITLDNQSATSAGTQSVTTTYNSNSNLTSAIEVPSKTYHNFGGYYTERNGGGTQLIDASGNFIANISGYIGSDKLWKYANDITLYAQWTEKSLTNYRTSCSSAATLVSIAVSGQTTTYNVGDSFSFDGTCTATYDDESTKQVTPTSVSSPDMSTASTKTVTVTYTENGVTVTTTYDIVVNVVKTATSLTWSADSYTATIASESNVFPTLTITPEAIKGSVTYSSSYPEYATIDAAGNIRLLAAGTTTITASYAGDEDYAAAEDTYTLTVEESTNCRWEEVTDLNDIATGDEVVITMTKGNYVWTISNEKHTSNTAPTTVDISANVEGQYLTTVNDGNKWVIEKNNDNLTFYSYTDQANYLYCTNDDNGVRVGTGTAEVFVVDGNYLKNIETTSPRYLGVSLNTEPYSWRCYTVTTSVIKDQTLKFYKKECLDGETFWVDYDLANVTCTTAPPHSQITKNQTITLEFTATDGYALPDNVTVTNAEKNWDKSTGTLTISHPTANVTITIEALELHTITWMVGSSSVLTEDVANGTGVTKTPTDDPADDAIGDCADTFMGWSETPLGSAEGQSAPSDLCTAAQMKSKHSSVTGDKTFYAVFATEEGGGAEVGTVIFSENFSSFNSGATMTGTKNSATGRTIYGDASVTYSYKNGSGAGTKIYNESSAGGTSPELLVGKNSSTFTITGIPNGGASQLQLTYKQNAQSLTSSVSGDGYSGGTNANTKATTSTIIIVGSANTFDLTFTGPSGDKNVRLDDIVITVYKGSATYSNYVTNCCELLPVTNLQVSGVTEKSATLTWTKPYSTTDITELQIRNADNDAVVVDDINPTTTTATINELDECTKYNYYVVSVGAECEVSSETITAQPFSGAKTVTFNYNGNGQANTTSSTSCGNTSITLPTPTWAGYRFMGWFNAASGGTKIGEAGASYKPTDDIPLYAQWEKEYTVTYNANGGSTTCANGNYIEGETVTVCTTNPTRTGHTFTGWTYSPSVTITDGKFVMPASDVTITAQWQVNSYTVTWNPNGGNWGGSTASIVETYEYGAKIVQPAAPQRDGYRFTGWSPAVSATMSAGNKTYTAQWKQNYTITFHDGNDVTPWTQTKDAESINLTEYVGTLACDDYQFAGWSTADTKYNDETANITTWVTGNYTPTANIDLYAVYSKGAVTNDFTLNCDGGVYEIWEKGTNQHMAGRQNGGGNKFYTTEWYNGDCTSCEGTDGAPFTITKVAENTYTLQNADGQYITRDSYDGNADELEIEDTWENADRYKWTISNGTNGTWRFTNKAATTYALVFYDNYFQLRTANNVTLGSSDYDLELTPAASNVYQSNPNCGPYYIRFETHGGEFIQGEYLYGEEQTGLTETTYSEFPAAELEGYTFAGWKDGSPIDDEITSDNASDGPYLKQAGEDLVVSSNKTYHAVYYYYDEEEDIDWSKEFTTSIYAEVNGMKYFLSGTPSSGTMSSTTDCGYVSKVTITPGTGANAGKYKITVNGVEMAPEANETDLVNGTYWWTITERSVGSGEYKISGQDKKNIVLFYSSWGHYTYNQGSEYGNGYYYPRFGKCLQHHWTSFPTDIYTMTWKIYEDIHATTTVQSGKTITALPTNPTDNALGCCSDKFMGWTVSTAQTIDKADVFTTLAEAQTKFPNITSNKTFYAVFATTAQGVGTSIADFSEMGYENGTAVTDQIILGDGEGHGDATITLQKAQSSKNDAKYYDDGEAVRVYAGSTITISSTYDGATIKSVTFEFSASDTEGDNIISVTGGDGTYSEGTWTGDATAVTFTIGGSTGHRRIASITVTTGVAGSQYTNYVTQCELSGEAAIGEGTVAYANEGTAIAVNCGNLSPKNTAATLTFPGAKNLTCPVTLTASEGFVLSTNKQSDTYQSKITIKPIKSGDNTGKLKNVYVRAIAPAMFSGEKNGTITVSGGEIATPFTVDIAAEVSCNTYTITLIDHLGNTIGTPTSHYEGDIIEEEPDAPTPDDCSTNYTFDGWSQTSVEYGSLVYNKVTFPFTMPGHDVTLIPVYRLLEDVDKADYHRVTSDLGADNWAGDYLIAYRPTVFADGRFGGTGDAAIGKANVQAEDFSTAIVNDVVPADPYGKRYHVTLESVEGGYVLKTQDGKYNYYTTNSSNDISVSDNQLTAAKYALNVVFESKDDIRLSLSGNAAGSVFRYGCSGNCFFRFYKDCGGNPIYLYKKSPLYTSSLICEEVTASDALVTSTAGQTVKVNVPITLTSSLHRTTDITAESDNTHFTITNLSGIEEGNHTLAVHYKPTVTTDGIETANIKIKVNNLPVNTFQVTGRHLPEKFVIATKVGATWYALPADMSSATNPVGVVIEVDETTMTATAPNTTSYTLFPVKTTTGSANRYAQYGDRVRFSAVNNEYKGLWANNAKDANTITNDAVIDEVTDGSSDASYEWIITTSVVDGNWQYTLQTDQQNNTNYLRYWTAATGAPKWGTYAAGNNQLYFLPVTETEPFDYQVVEWYPTKMLIQTDATIANPTAKIGDEQFNDITCNNKGSKLYEIAGLPLESNPTKVLTIKFSDGGNNYTNATAIPVIISQSATTVSSAPFTTLTKDVYNYADLVVRDGAKLTIDGGTHAENTFFNVTIYPTSKISVPEGEKLTVHSLTFFGGIDEIYNGSTYTLNKYGVPQLSLKGTLGKTIPQIDYIMRVNLDQMYQVGVPYDVNLNEVTYWDGTAITLGSQLYVSTYDGDARAKLDWNNTWRWEVNFTEKILKAGVGYTISAEPQFGETYSILRLPMKNNITSGETEAQKASIVVTAHGMDNPNLTDNHKGWNYLSNPYMTSISGAKSGGVEDGKIVVGYLVETGKGPWEWKEDNYRYVTIPTDDGTNYSQQKFTEATLKPFKSFFLQIANSGDLSFALASRQNAPARYLQQEAAPREVEFEVLLSNNTQSDNTGLLISEEFSPAYEINADLEKMMGNMSIYTIYNGYNLAFNALSPTNAEERIPMGYVVPNIGEYTFNLDERGDLDDIEHIYLLDHDSSITTDLMEDIYTFTATEKKNDHRFAISVILKAEEEEETPTHLETLEWDSAHPYKFIYQDKMYILRNGVIYDAMGKQVQTINK